MKYIFRCEKLVRDRIPDLMSEPGHTVIVETLDRQAHIFALKKKLTEEANEVEAACTRDEIIEEIADIKEVLDALMLKLSISRHEIDEIKRKKSLRNGGFDRGLYLKAVEAPMGSSVAERLLKQPSQYLLLETRE
jgi:predicted house-cleaning noncanonical NTP pyrophosphatase (MazG superfamily)